MARADVNRIKIYSKMFNKGCQMHKAKFLRKLFLSYWRQHQHLLPAIYQRSIIIRRCVFY